ncbi:MAG: hypothetical protein HYR91_04150 [Flavobacteriia bacterium]|nr:hypothetical protein [Flavobacteriia bacterium]
MESVSNTPKKKTYKVAPTSIIIDTKQRSWWNSLTDGQRRFVTSLSITLGVSIIAITAFYFAKRKVQEINAKKEQSKSFGKDNHATWAKQFRQAFENDGWWGTDVPLVRQTMRAIPSKEDFYSVEQSYRKMYKGASLIEEMSDELTKLEYQEMLAIKNAKPSKSNGTQTLKIYDPVGWAKRFHSALDYSWLGFMSGTDEDAIVAVFQEIPTQKAFWATANSYNKMYSVHLWDDLDGDLDWSLDWRALLKKKPKK